MADGPERRRSGGVPGRAARAAALGSAVLLLGLSPLGPAALEPSRPVAADRLIRPRREVLKLGAAGLAARPLAGRAEENLDLKAEWAAYDGVRFLTDFNEDSYGAMRDDTRRTPQFIKAIKARVEKAGPGTLTVLDIGTGPFALFALVAARAGAKKVYAVEANPEAAERAREFVSLQTDIPEGTVEVIEGFTTAISLPTKVDLICAEIVGSFGSEENMIQTIRDAQERFMKDPYNPQNYIPASVQTYGAPICYALHPILTPTFAALKGQPLRVNCLDRTVQLLSDPQLFEDVKFYDKDLQQPATQVKNFEFLVSEERLKSNFDAFFKTITNDDAKLPEDEATKLARGVAYSFSGMAFWPRLLLDPAGQVAVETRGPKGEHQKSHWQTLLPLMTAKPVPVQARDRIEIAESALFEKDIIRPTRYTLKGSIVHPAA